MKLKLRSALAGVLSAFMLAGCTLPGETVYNNNHEMLDSYSYTPVEETAAEEAYSWIIQPSISADNIIVFDGSRVDPDDEKNKAYMNYAVIRQNGRYGLIDYSGNFIIKPEYDDFYTCWCGEIVLVNVIDDREGVYEYCTVDSTKQISTVPQHTYDRTPTYYWDISSEKVFFKRANEDSVSEYTGKKAVAVTEANVTLDDYGHYIAEAVEDAKCGLARKGELIAELIYKDYYAPGFKGAGATCIAFQNDEGKWGYLDSDGNVIIDFQCDGDPSAYNGRTTDDENKTHPYLFNGDYVPVSIGGYYGYYDIEGECVVKAGEFGQARPVSNGRAWVKQGDLWGVIQLGEIVEEETEKKKDDSSKAKTSSTTTTTTAYTQAYWDYTTEAQTDWEEDEPEVTQATDEYGNPIYTDYYDPTETTLGTDYYDNGEVTNYTDYNEYPDTPAVTDDGNAGGYEDTPVYTEPPYDPTPTYDDPVIFDPTPVADPANEYEN